MRGKDLLSKMLNLSPEDLELPVYFHTKAQRYHRIYTGVDSLEVDGSRILIDNDSKFHDCDDSCINFICPRSSEGPWEYPRYHHWYLAEDDMLHCSYCGSIQADKFESFVEESLKTNSSVSIEATTKSYKFYIRFGSRRAKFYTQHFTSQEQVDRVNKLWSLRSA